MTQRTTHTTRTGIALPEGSFSPSNYVGDPNGGAFVDWGAEFAERGLPSPAEANEFGTPSLWKGMPTGFGKLPGGAPQPPPQQAPQHAPPQHAAPPQGPPAHPQGVRPPQPPMQGPPPMAAPQGTAPAMTGRAMPFATQLAPLLSSMGHPMAPPGAAPQAPGLPPGYPQVPGYPPAAPPAMPPHPGMAPGMAPGAVPPRAQPPHGPPVQQPQQQPPHGQQPHAAMSEWIDWDAAMSALMGELPGAAPAAGPPAPPPPAKKPPKPSRPGTSTVAGRGAGKPFVYGADDEGATEKSLDALLSDLQKAIGQAPAVPPPSLSRQAPARPSPSAEARDYAGRVLRKGIYAFRDTMGRDTDLPDAYLYDYLCAFIEEAYEHESRENEHSYLQANGQVAEMARAVMSELVQTIPRNKNLLRAAQKYNVTRASIEAILVARGIFKPRADSAYSGDGNSAMGAYGLHGAIGDFAFSRTHEIAPFIGSELAPVTPRKLATRVDDVSGLVKSDARNPAEVFLRSGMRPFSVPQPSPVAKASPACPVHGGREIHKAMNLWNPMLPCTCHGTPNAHG